MTHLSIQKFSCGIALAMLALTSCGKKGEPGPNGNASGALLPAVTGWQKVTTIPYQKSTLGLPGSQSMTGYDITMVDNDLAVLYSENFAFTGSNSSNYFKTRFAPSAATAGKPVAVSFTKLTSGSETVQNLRFLPGSFNAFNTVFTKPSYWDVGIYHQDNTKPAAQTLGNFNQVWSTRWYPGGGISMGQRVQNANGSLSWYYQYPETGNFKMVTNQWSADTTSWTHSIPFSFADGEYYDFIISVKDDKTYFSVIRNKQNTPYVAPNPTFDLLTRNLAAGLLPSEMGSFAPVIVSSEVTNDQFTVLLASFQNGGSDRIKALHAYRWTKGTDSFVKLYGDITVSDELQKALIGPSPEGSIPGPLGPDRANTIRFTPDGTAYLLFEYVSPNTNYRYTAVGTFNGAGAKTIGKYENSAVENNYYYQFGLSACRYYNGAFYAVVQPKNEVLYNYEHEKFRMELVKLVP